jgi:hypothetical protein
MSATVHFLAGHDDDWSACGERVFEPALKARDRSEVTCLRCKATWPFRPPVTILIMWGEEDRPAQPVATFKGSCEEAINWCETEAATTLVWRHYISRGASPGTTHWRGISSAAPGETFEVWVLTTITT